MTPYLRDDTCPPEDLLVAAALDDLEAAEAARVDRHVARCPRCSASHERLVRALEDWRTPPPAAAPTSVLARLLDAQADGIERPRRRGDAPAWFPQLGRGPATMLGLAVVFLAGLLLGRGSAPDGPDQEAAAYATPRASFPVDDRVPVQRIRLRGNEAIPFEPVGPLDLPLAEAWQRSAFQVPSAFPTDRDSL